MNNNNFGFLFILLGILIAVEMLFNSMIGSIFLIGGLMKAMLLPFEAVFDILILLFALYIIVRQPAGDSGGERSRQ